MKKNKLVFGLLAFCWISFVVGCKTKNETLQSVAEEKKEIQNQKETPIDEKWKTIKSLEELSGKWISERGNFYQYPFDVDGKNYLRFAEAATDDTKLWQSYAEQNSISLNALWNKRFSCIQKIYGNDFYCYPFSLDNFYEEGVKVSLVDGKIMGRHEKLFPSYLVEMNLDFFQVSNLGKLRECGRFYFYNEDESEEIFFMESTTNVYESCQDCN